MVVTEAASVTHTACVISAREATVISQAHFSSRGIEDIFDVSKIFVEIFHACFFKAERLSLVIKKI